MHRYLSFALYSHCAAAAVLSAPTAAITAPAFLHRRAATTVGYYSTGSSDGTVQCMLCYLQQQHSADYYKGEL